MDNRIGRLSIEFVANDDSVRETINSIVKEIQNMQQSITDTFSNMNVSQDFNKQINSMKNKVVKATKDIQNATSGIKGTNVQSDVNVNSNGVDDAQQKVSSLSDRLKELVSHPLNTILHPFQSLSSLLQRNKEEADGLAINFSKIGSASSGISPTVGNMASGVISGLKRMVFATLGVRSAFMLLKKAVSTYMASNPQLQAQLNGIWQAFGNLLAPAIKGVISALSTLMGTLNAVWKALTGKNLFGAISKGSGSASGGVKKTTKAVKELKKELASFDEINNLSADDSSGGGGGSGGGGVGADTNFDTGNLSSAIEDALAPIKNAWKEYGQSFIDSFMYGLNQIKLLVISIGESFYEVWTNGTGEKTIGLILQIFTDIFNIVGLLAQKLREAWEENENGTKIIQHIWDICNGILEFIKLIGDGILKLLGYLDFGPIFSGIEKGFGIISEIVSSTVEMLDGLLNGDFDKFADTFSKSFSNIFGMFTDALNSVDWLSLGANIADLLVDGLGFFISGFATLFTNVDWLEIVGSMLQGLGTALGAIFQGLAGLVGELILDLFEIDWGALGSEIQSWGSEFFKNLDAGFKQSMSNLWDLFTEPLKQAWDNVLAFFGIHSPSKKSEDMGVNIVLGIVNGLANLVDSLLSPFKDAWDSVVKLFYGAGKFFGKVVDNIVKNFKSIGDSIAKPFKTAYSSVTSVWNGVKSFFSNLFNSVKSNATSIWNGIGNSITSVMSKVKTAWNGLTSFASKVTSGISSAFTSLIDKIKSAVNVVIRGFNKAVPYLNKLPLIELKPIKELASGGIAYGDTLALIGEYQNANRNPEVVAPLDKLNGIMLNTMKEIMGGQNNYSNQTQEDRIVYATINMNGKPFYQEMVKEDKKQKRLVGKSPLGNG